MKVKKQRSVIISIATHSLETVIASIFKKLGYKIYYAKNYYEVVKKSSDSNVHEIVVGGTIENYDCITLARRIKMFDNNSKRIIIVNVNLNTRDIKEYKKNNIFFLTPPFSKETLISIIRKKKHNNLKNKKILYVGSNEKDIEALYLFKKKYSFELLQTPNFENIKIENSSLVIIDRRDNQNLKSSFIEKLRCSNKSLIPIITIVSDLEEDKYVRHLIRYPSIDKIFMKDISLYFSKYIKQKNPVLVASSDILLNTFINYLLKSNGYKVIFANSVKECLRFMKHKKIALTIVNEEKNIKYQTVVKEYKPSEEKPLIVLSDGYLSENETESAKHSFDFLKKPIDKHVFLKTLKTGFLIRQMVDNLEYQNRLLTLTNKKNMQMLEYGTSEITTPSIVINNYASTIKGEISNIIQRQTKLVQRIIDVITDYQSIQRYETILVKTKEDIVSIFEYATENNSVLLDLKNIKISFDAKETIPPVFLDRKIIEKVFSSLMLYIYHCSLPKKKIAFKFIMLDYLDEHKILSDIFRTNPENVKINIEVSFIVETDKTSDGNDDKNAFDFVLSASNKYLELHNGRLYKHRKDNYEHIIMLIPV